MSVAVGIIHGDTMDALFVHSFVRLGNRGLKPIFARGGAGRLDNARNAVAARFLESDSEWLLTLDTDMVFTPDNYSLLRATAHPSKRPIVSGIYFVDERPPRPAAGNLVDGHIHSITDWGEEPFEVEYVGAGFMLTHRSVFEKLGPEPYRQDVTTPTGVLVGEDYAFCYRAREAGFPIYVHPGVFVGHVKPRVLGWETP